MHVQNNGIRRQLCFRPALIRNQQVGGSSPLAGTIKSMGYDHWRVFKEFGVTYGVTFSWSLNSTLARGRARQIGACRAIVL